MSIKESMPLNIPITIQQDGRIFMDVKLKNDNIKMMLDTYAAVSIFPKKWVNQVGFTKTSIKYSTRDYLNNKAKSQLYVIDSLTISENILINNLLVKTSKILDPFNVGVLGLDFINNYNWKFMFSDSAIELSQDVFDITDSYIINTFPKGQFPFFIFYFEGIEQKMIVDLGAGKSFYIPAKSELGKALISKYQPQRKLVKTGGANSDGVVDYQYHFEIPEIDLQGRIFKNVDITLSETSQLYFIGTSFLSKGELIYNSSFMDTIGQIGFKILE